MSSLSDLAFAHQDRRIRLADQTAGRVRTLWRRADVDALDASWDALAPVLTAQVVAAQVSAARQSGPYVNRVAPEGRVSLEPAMFGGSMEDGRDVGPALFGGVTTTKKAIRAGITPRLAFEAGAAFMTVLGKAAVADAGRAADATLATGKGYTRYVRVVSPGACSRCAILAGSDRYYRHFERHPACKCTSLPVKDGAEIPKGLYGSPTDYFESLSRAEQDRAFTAGGAEAIRKGADPISVVNARRGAYTRPSVPATSRSLGRSGSGFGYRRSIQPRLMPEQIIERAGTDHALAVELLRRNGYLR